MLRIKPAQVYWDCNWAELGKNQDFPLVFLSVVTLPVFIYFRELETVTMWSSIFFLPFIHICSVPLVPVTRMTNVRGDKGALYNIIHHDARLLKMNSYLFHFSWFNSLIWDFCWAAQTRAELSWKERLAKLSRVQQQKQSVLQSPLYELGMNNL